VVIGNGGTLKAPVVAAPFSGNKTITIESGGTLDFGIAVATLAPGVIIKNGGTVATATISDAALAAIIAAAPGTVDSPIAITASGFITTLTAAFTVPQYTELTASSATFANGVHDITVNGDAEFGAVAVPQGSVTVGANGSLTVSGSLAIVAAKVLTVNGSLTVDNGGAVTVNGTIGGTGSVATSGTGSVSLANANATASAANLEWALGQSGEGKIAKLSTATATLANGGTVPAGLALTTTGALTVSADKTLTVEGELALGTGGTVAGEGTFATAEDGFVSVVNAAGLAAALDKAGTSKITKLTLKGTATLTTAATVPAGLELTIGTGGTLTVASASSSSKDLTVTGTVVLAGTGSIVTAGTDTSAADITITGTGSITAGGIVISGAGAVNTNTTGVTLKVDTIDLAASTTLAITESAEIQAGGANGITFKAGSYVFGASETTGVLTVPTAPGKPTLTLSNNATALAIGDDIASELVFGSESVYLAGGTSTAVTPGATGSAAKDDVKLTFIAGAQIVSGTGAGTGTGAALTTAGAVTAGNMTYTVGSDTTVTKAGTASTWSGAVNGS
jgi:flagellar basal body rod protein FlgF